MTDTQIETARRNKDIYNLRQQGVDVKEIAKEFGITTVRVYQITNSYKPEPQPVIQKPRTVFQMLFGGRGG
jgi:Mor family transcriptional regulator|tara:strand:+ start:555 stop:767 length:213 start_codon:yes stop_codon:yes gene_type:complete